MESDFQAGDRIIARQLLSWTLYEFDDYPLVVQRGERGTIDRVERDGEDIWIVWDKDQHKEIPKGITLSNWKLPPIKKVVSRQGPKVSRQDK